MNTTLSDNARLAAQIQLQNRRVSNAVIARITDLAEGGLTAHEIAAHLGTPPQLVNLVLRGAPPGVSK